MSLLREAKELQASADPVVRALGVVLERLDETMTRVETLTARVNAAVSKIEDVDRARKAGDEKLDRSLARMADAHGAMARAQGVQATKLGAICEHLGIKPSIHEQSSVVRGRE